jgi:hypothetical protein
MKMSRRRLPGELPEKMKKCDPELNSYWGTICTLLLIKAF